MRIATWNVNSVIARLPRLLAWLESAQPDVLCLQELKCTEEAVPRDELARLGYDVAAYGLGRWNGVAILSKAGIEDVRRGLIDEPLYGDAAEPRAIGAICRGVRVWSVYVPNGREVGHPHYDYKLRWLEALHGTVVAESAGDISLFAESTHITEPERKALAVLRDAGLADIVPRPLKYDHPFTYWDYRQLAFPKNNGMRIDLVYGNEKFASTVRDSYVDREARKGKGASDHAPVVVDLETP
jgi:exodeoxyribonuclease-3